MSILKPALWISAAVVAAAMSIPALAQQPTQNESPTATQGGPNAGRGQEDRGRPSWRWRDEDRYSSDDEDERGGSRRYRDRRFGRDGDDYDRPWRGGPREGMMEHHGMMGRRMMGRGMMGHAFIMRALCGPEGGRLGNLMLGRLERITQPTDQQRPSFDKLKDAVGKATNTVRASCSTERPITPPARLAAAEKRLSAWLDAVRTVRPAMDEFYGSLSDEQKARLYLARLGRIHEGLRGWDRDRENRWGEREGRGRDRDGGWGGREQFRERMRNDDDDDEDDDSEYL